jgi:hypothetical protein
MNASALRLRLPLYLPGSVCLVTKAYTAVFTETSYCSCNTVEVCISYYRTFQSFLWLSPSLLIKSFRC